MTPLLPLLAVSSSAILETLGRLHVAVVHFPIALLLVAGIVELWGVLRRHTRPSPSAILCLTLGAASALLAAVMGWFHQKGFAPSATLTLHLWLGLATAALALIPLILVPLTRFKPAYAGYRLAVFTCALLVSLEGHLGGTLTHGQGYLTELLFQHPEPTPPAVLAIAPGQTPYDKDVQPLLAATCYDCHGPTKKRGGLRVDSLAFMLKGGSTGPAIIPGKSADSLLIQRVLGLGGEKRMPLDHAALNNAQISLLKKWIDSSATTIVATTQPTESDHWAYNKPKEVKVPTPKSKEWVRNPIDAFVLARLEKEGITPSPEADRPTLIRRLSLDLIGLPPSPKEVDAFLNDKDSNAYEKVVDRLLASAHYGERMAVYWLDLVRFGDTTGIHNDTGKNITAYRDWVINSINSNKHFDQFTIEQLAGDLLPNATIEQKIASAYNRLLITSEEGGAQPKEYTVKYAADRVRNISGVWLGSTLGCAECHNHKFDPFTQKDFYSMGAFFADVKDNAVGAYARVAEMPVPTPSQSAELKKHDDAIVLLKAKLDTPTPELELAQRKWEAYALQEVVWKPLNPASIKTTGNSILAILPDQSILAGGPLPDKETYTFTATLPPAKKVTALRLEVLPDISLPSQGPGRAENGNFALTALHLTVDGKPVTLQNITTDHAQDQWPGTDLVDGNQHIPGGWAILPDVGQSHLLEFETTGDLTAGEMVLTLDQQHGTGHSIGRFRISVTDAVRPVGVSRLTPRIAKIISIPWDKRNNKQRDTALAYYRTIAPELDPIRAELIKHEQAKASVLASSRKCEVTEAMDEPRITRILSRGNWQDESGEIVKPAVPRFLGEVKPSHGDRATRLDLAQWLVSGQNPLTARVYVNRLWKMFYGIGLSKSLDDLGTQGEKPCDAELLDYLANEFVHSGWDPKHMVRLLVTSSAYRQSSDGSKTLREKDPFNRLVARQSIYRLDAEFVRDNALAFSGLIDLDVGGESAKPYQPAGYWDFLNFPKRTYPEDHGPLGHRRSVYTWWQRTFLHPSLLNFDAPAREECTALRPQSNTPLQALDLLNDPIFVECARAFAIRILTQAPTSDTDRLTFAYQQALSRNPTDQERQVLETLLTKHLKEYTADPKSASLVAATGETPTPKSLDPIQLAAWTSITRTIINLHETVNRF